MTRIRPGTVFEIDVDDHIRVPGYLVSFIRGNHQAMLAALYDVLPQDWTGDTITWVKEHDPVVLLMTFTLGFRRGKYRAVGILEDPPSIQMPLFRVAIGTPDHVAVSDHNYDVVRTYAGSPSALPLHTIVSTGRAERIARAIAGVDPWDAEFNRYKYPPVNAESEPKGVTSRLTRLFRTDSGLR